MIGAWGLPTAERVLLILGQALWLGAAWLLIRSLIREPRQAMLALLLAIALPIPYGGEPILTPRLYAEAAGMAGLALCARGRIAAAILPLAVAAALHPVIALPALAMAGLYAIAADRRWLWALPAGALIAVALCRAGVDPFSRLPDVVDGAWLQVIRKRDRLDFLLGMGPVEICRLLSLYALTGLGLIFARKPLRRFLLAAGALELGASLATFLGVDLAHSLLLLDAQPWRVFWLFALAANIGASAPALRLLDSAPGTLPLSKAVVPLALAVLAAARVPIFHLAASVATPAALLAMALEGRGRRVAPWLARALAAAALFAAVLTAGAVGMVEWGAPQLPDEAIGLAAIVLAMGLAAAAWIRPTGEHRGHARAMMTVLALVLLVAAAARWDRRSDFQRYVEDDAPAPADLARLLPRGASVYWEGGLDLLWLKLRRASYWSCDQGLGGVFFRSTAMEYARRAKALAALRSSDFAGPADGVCPSVPESRRRPPDRADLAQACRAAGDLDDIALASPVDGAYFATWRPPVEMVLPHMPDGAGIGPARMFYLYRCADLE